MSIVHKYAARLVVPLLLMAVISCGKDHGVEPSRPVIGDDLVFSSTRDGGIMDLFTVNADGSGLHRLTSDTLEDWQPRWSPDGAKIVFVHGYGQNPESSSVTVMNGDGSGRLRLSNDRFDVNPSWSPDGTQIAYQHDPDYTVNELWVVNADGTSPHLLISSDSLNGTQGNEGAVRGITWTPQSTFLGYDWFGLVQFNGNGTGRTRLLSLNWVKNGDPRLSPDGNKIVFTWGGPIDTDELDVWIVNVDGTELKRLTNIGRAHYPTWSPDGRKIAFVNNDEWWSMNVDGTYQVPLLVLSSFGQDLSGDWK